MDKIGPSLIEKNFVQCASDWVEAVQTDINDSYYNWFSAETYLPPQIEILTNIFLDSLSLSILNTDIVSLTLLTFIAITHKNEL